MHGPLSDPDVRVIASGSSSVIPLGDEVLYKYQANYLDRSLQTSYLASHKSLPLYRRFFHVDSLAFAAFLASFYATIPTSDFSLFLALLLDLHGLEKRITSFRGNDEISLGNDNQLSPESSPPNFRSLRWYWTSPSLAGSSDFVNQHGMPPVPGFAFASSVPILAN